MSAGRRRVAILGGGQAALTAALQLTDPRNQNPAAVTIYQLGWRLGGKGATGRPTDGTPPRIMEHGLHEWFGFYDNSFRQIRDVYKELDRPPGAPLATWKEAFVGTDTGFMVECIECGPLFWRTTYQPRPGEPGDGDAPFEHAEHMARALEHLDHKLGELPPARRRPGEVLAAGIARVLLRAAALVARGHADARLKWALEAIVLRVIAVLLWLFIRVLWRFARRDILTVARTEDRRVWIQSNLGCACIAGAIHDGVFRHGFDVLNELDFREWLRRHAYPDGGVMLHSTLVEAVYIGCFAYVRGANTPETGNLEAGTALRGMTRTLFGYQGYPLYRFAAGTADSAYAPVYEVLRKRGVDIRFFSRVERLELDADGRVARVHLGEQAQIKDGRPYEPLFDVDGLPCWPLEPLWDQLVDGETLRGADFEWPSAALRKRERHVAVEAGSDYDDVVLGISIAALGEMCDALVERYPAWDLALAQVQTVRTQSLQLWLREDAVQLGFEVVTPQLTPWRYTTASPLNVWGDFSEVLPWEQWPQARKPGSLAYFTATMPDGHDFPDQASADRATREAALLMLRRGLPVILPAVLNAEGEFRWSLLLGPDADRDGRLEAQWIRANVLPSERYVLSVAGSTKFRLPVHDPNGPPNLYLAGDWTQCTLNCGCMEAATMSGMLCSNALSGYPKRDAITGIDF